jgi:hypothetical protein
MKMFQNVSWSFGHSKFVTRAQTFGVNQDIGESRILETLGI